MFIRRFDYLLERNLSARELILPLPCRKYTGHIKNKGGKIIIDRQPKIEARDGTCVVKAGNLAEKWARFYDEQDMDGGAK